MLMATNQVTTAAKAVPEICRRPLRVAVIIVRPSSPNEPNSEFCLRAGLCRQNSAETIGQRVGYLRTCKWGEQVLGVQHIEDLNDHLCLPTGRQRDLLARAHVDAVEP